MLAAGASTRLGAPKQLVVYRGEPLVRRAAMAATAAGATPVVVVLGAHADAIAPTLAGVPDVSCVRHEHWARGLASSLAAGIRASMSLADCDGVLITVSDQPLVGSASLRELLAAFDDARRIIAAEYADTVGVPAVVGREHFDNLLQLTGDVGAGRWLRARLPAVTRVPMPEAAADVDTAADAARLDREQ